MRSVCSYVWRAPQGSRGDRVIPGKQHSIVAVGPATTPGFVVIETDEGKRLVVCAREIEGSHIPLPISKPKMRG